RSGFPNAYAKWESKATAVVNAVSGGAGLAVNTVGQCATPGQPGQVTAGGWTIPVAGAKIGSLFGENRGNHRHAGVDLIVPKRTKVVSVADGIVIRAICDAGINCDRDGSSSTPGCGWYVDIRHAGGIISRYCHMVARPLVALGQH